MYKAKLQELSERRQWELPQYSGMNDGEVDCPRFRASVLVNGVSFHSPPSCTSTQDAFNQAAMLAFLHFSSSDSSLVSSEPPAGKPKYDENHDKLQKVSDIKNGSHHQFKSKLHEFAQKNILKLPVYSHTREGPSHAVQFKASVSVDERSFESPEYFSTLKDAEHAAAKVALAALPPNHTQEIQKNECRSYKNLLQELAQKGGHGLPIYKTVTSGVLPNQIFFSTVVVLGENFSGKGGRSKKQAEMNAAMVAYTALSARKAEQNGSGSSSTFIKEFVVAETTLKPSSQTVLPIDGKRKPQNTSSCEIHASKRQVQDALLTNLPSRTMAASEYAVPHVPLQYIVTLLPEEGDTMPSSPEHNTGKMALNEVSSYLTPYIEHGQDVILPPRMLKSTMKMPEEGAACSSPEHSEIAFQSPSPQAKLDMPTERSGSSLFPSVEHNEDAVSSQSPHKMVKLPEESGPSFAQKQLPPSAMTRARDVLPLSTPVSNNEKTTNYYMLCNRFAVYTRFPDITLPEGVTVLPIGESEWVPVSLDYQNERERDD